MFRDEALSLSAKRQRQVKAKQSGSAVPSATFAELQVAVIQPCPASLLQKVNSPCSSSSTFLTPSLGTSAEEQATCFFFRNYVLGEDKFHNSNFQYLSDLYGCRDVGEALTETVICVGLAGMANFWKASNITRSAKSRYASALRLISSRLGSIQEAKADQVCYV